MLRIAAILSLTLALFSCSWKTDHKAAEGEKESPLISSLKDASLPCFRCHSYEKFSVDQKGRFSHEKHAGLGVHCNQCHLIKPHREMALNKDTCNGCHKMTSISFASSGLPVNFSHQDHSKRHGCRECHPVPFRMKKGSNQITMEEMYKGGTCGKCHNGKAAFSSKECAKCHNLSAIKKDLVYPSNTMSAAVFSHETHTAMFECGNCHTSIFRYKKGGSGMKMDDLYENKFCGKCHNGEAAFGSSECQNCHK
ncbi:MAG: hypothetical protein HZB33_00190 [Nitrospirae bacterium]|nr:hypothetical protein [Nitrospirota bacterium]